MNPHFLLLRGALALACVIALCSEDTSAASVSPTEATSSPEPLRPLSSNDTLSVDFPDEDIRDILRNVAEYFEIEIDLPAGLRGRTSLRLRDVTWRQVFKVVLAPIDYDFYERDGVVIVRTKEAIGLLPPVVRAVEIRHQKPEELVTVLNENWAGMATFSPAHLSLVYRTHPRHVPNVEAAIASYDSPDVRLNPFPRQIIFRTGFLLWTRFQIEPFTALEDRRAIGSPPKFSFSSRSACMRRPNACKRNSRTKTAAYCRIAASIY